MYQPVKKQPPVGDISNDTPKQNIAKLTNEQQLYIMDQVKSKRISVEGAVKLASQLSEDSSDLPPEIRREPKTSKISNVAEIYHFAVIFYPDGYRQPGIICYLQIDFTHSIISFVEKCKTKLTISFENVKSFVNRECTNQLKILTKVGTMKLTANSEDKDFIFELLGMIVLDNECTSIDNIKKKELDRKSMNHVFRTRNILKEGILEKKVDASIILWLERYIEIKEGEFSYAENKESPNNYLVHMWTSSIEVKATSDSEFFVKHNNREYCFRVKNKGGNVKIERDAWIKAFCDASARKNIKTQWMENVRLTQTFIVENELYANEYCRNQQKTPPADCTDGFNIFTPVNKKNYNSNVKDEELSCKEELKKMNLPIPPPIPKKIGHKTLRSYSQKQLKQFPVPSLPKELLKAAIWNDIPDLTANLKHALLDEKFAVSLKVRNTPQVPTNEGKVYLNEKKAQNIMILMKGRFLQIVREIPSVLVSLTELNVVHLEDIRILQKYQPDDDEIDMYHQIQSTVELKSVDKCMLKLSLIPYLRDRLELIHTLWTFHEENEEFLKSVSAASAICDEILTSQRFVKVLVYVVAILNYLNTSDNKLSRAIYGFDLCYLSHLNSIRGVTNYTVLKALKCHLVDDDDRLLQYFPDDFQILYKNEILSIKSLNIGLEIWKQTMANVKIMVISIKKKMKNISNNDAKFFEEVEAFRLKKIEELQKVSKKASQCFTKYQRILEKFALNKETSSEKLFENLQIFIKEYLNES